MRRRAAPAPAGSPTEATLFRFDRCLIRLDTREVFLDGRAQPVRSRVFDLLVYLLRRRPFVVAKDELLQHVWGRTAVSDSLLSRTVVEARRVIGDDAARPRLLVNVRGSGYRLQAEVSASMQVPGTADDDDVEAAVKDHLRQVALAYEQHDDQVTAQQHAELAYGMAERAGLNVERGRALVWLGWLTLRSAGPLQAAQYVTEAMAVARSEEHGVLMAQAQLADARVRLAVGDAERALHQLKSAYPLLGEPGLEGHRYRCENLLGAVYWHLGDNESGLEWCRRSQRTATTWPNRSCLVRSLGNEVATLLELGDRHERALAPESARAAWSSAMAVLRSIADHPVVATLPTLRAQLLSHESALLARAGEYTRALALQEQAEQPFAAGGTTVSHADLDRHLSLLNRRVDLLHRAGRYAEAQEAVGRAIALAEQHEQRHWLPELYEMGSRAAESCGEWSLALRLARQRHEAFVRLQGQRSLKLARMLELDASVDKIRRDTEAALRRAEAAEDSLMRLRRQLHAMELSLLKRDARASVALLDFVAVQADAHHEAIRRGLPFWLVRFEAPARAAVAAGEGLPRPAAAGDADAGLPPRADVGGYPAVTLDDGAVLVALGSIGRARAEQAVAGISPALGPSGRATERPVQWIDATGFDSLAAAISAFRQ